MVHWPGLASAVKILALFPRRFAASAVLVVSSCLPIEPAGRSEALETRLAALEAQVEQSKRQVDGSLALIPPRLTDLEQRIEESERFRNQDRTEAQLKEKEALARLQLMQRQFETLDDAVLWERAVELSLTKQSFLPALTRYGTFLVKLTGFDKTGSGYDLQLLLTNVTPFRIDSFRLHGDFGRKFTALPAEATVGQRVEALDRWELSLLKFEQIFKTVLEREVHTPVVLHLPASRLADLEYIRLWIDVTAAVLPPAVNKGFYGTLDASRPDPSLLHVLPSDAGTFYLKLEKCTPSAGGQQLLLRFGNPLGMTINRLRLHGTLGKKAPTADPKAPPPKGELALLQWRQSRRSFSKELSVNVEPMQWTELTLELPATSQADLELVECRVDILELHLKPRK